MAFDAADTCGAAADWGRRRRACIPTMPASRLSSPASTDRAGLGRAAATLAAIGRRISTTPSAT